MSNDTQRTVRFLKSWAINTLAVLLAVKIAHTFGVGLSFGNSSSPAAPILTALVLGILNAFIRPILMLLALPLLIFTLGLFTLVINALLLCMVAWMLGPDYFRVDSFLAAFIGATIISIVSVALNIMTGGARVSVRKGPPPPPRPPGKSGPGGDGPVIDV